MHKDENEKALEFFLSASICVHLWPIRFLTKPLTRHTDVRIADSLKSGAKC
jgi:hypothetical protein